MIQGRYDSRAFYDALQRTHDSALPDWGPYSKLMAGVSHVRDKARGAAFNLSVFPVRYRGKAELPCEKVETNFHPWYAAADLSAYTYRFELEWKDRVYCDVTYVQVATGGVAIVIDACNDTDANQMIGLHYLASMQFPKSGKGFQAWKRPVCAGEYALIDGVRYEDIRVGQADPRDNLAFDGRFFCEELGDGLTNGRCLGQKFGRSAGDSVTYRLKRPAGGATRLFMRLKGHTALELSGAAVGVIEVDSDEFEVFEAPLAAGEECDTLTLSCLTDGGLCVDCIAVSGFEVAFEDEAPAFVPQLDYDGSALKLDYGGGCAYDIWRACPDTSAVVRELRGSDWEQLMNSTIMNHVSRVFKGDELAHYANLYERPVFLKPHEHRRMCGFVCESGTPLPDLSAITAPAWSDDDPYALSMRLMRATMLTNIVFPIYVQGEYIRHFTPGKTWDSLYTWDSGFIGLGFTSINVERAVDILNCYLTQPGNRHAAFIHHGSPVPVQAYVYKEIWDRTGNRDMLAAFYARMKQYYEFMMGRLGSSNTRRLKSGLLNTFSYFYNTGGWDDYPPQIETHRRALTNRVAPCVTSAHMIVFARIMRHSARILGLDDGDEYARDIAELGAALQRYAYDPESGYFGYVCHDEQGNPCGILRDADGTNYNMGLDGVEPALAGICSAQQEERLIGYVMDEARLMTGCGISTVDQTAPYYRDDGYWNGAVWMPHQWFMFLEMLAANHPEHAVAIARRALDTWRRETDATYNCYEHFIVGAERGGGWHHFGGLSAPVLVWYDALRRPGTITAPVEAFVMSYSFDAGCRSADISVDIDDAREAVTLLITMAPGVYAAHADGTPVAVRRFGDTLAVELPGNRRTELKIRARDR